MATCVMNDKGDFFGVTCMDLSGFQYKGDTRKTIAISLQCRYSLFSDVLNVQ